MNKLYIVNTGLVIGLTSYFYRICYVYVCVDLLHSCDFTVSDLLHSYIAAYLQMTAERTDLEIADKPQAIQGRNTTDK